MRCGELFSKLGDDEVLVLDCRDRDSWERLTIHIPGALRMTLGELDRAAHILPDDELIVLCGCAQDGSDARKALRVLQLRGRHAVCLEGGLHAWVTAGYPIEHHLGLGVSHLA